MASAGAVIRKLASESVIFSSMLKEDLLRVSRVAFQSKINEQLRDLQHLDFEAAGMAAFRDAMMAEAKELIKMGAKSFEKTSIKVEFMGQEMTVVIESVHDEWEYRLNAALKTTAVSSGALQMMPWESLCYIETDIPGARAHCKVPSECLDRFQASRAAALELLRNLGGESHLTLKEMQRSISTKFKHLKQLDRSFDLDLCFLESHVETILKKRLHTQMLDVLPGSLAAVTFKEVFIGANVGSGGAWGAEWCAPGW